MGVDPKEDARAGLGVENELDDPPDWSAFLQQVQQTAEPFRQALVDSFITLLEEDEEYGFPLTVETMAVYLHTASATSVQLPGDHNGWNPQLDVLQHLAGTDLFYLEKTYPLTARLDYKFVVDGSWILDPRNPRQVSGGFGPNSELVMPDYVDPPEIYYHPDLPRGETTSFTFHSELLDNDRMVKVYTPSGYEGSGEEYPVIYVHDGGDYDRLGKMTRVLDYCIGHNYCQPLIAVLVDPVNRNEEYWLNDAFREMFVQELVPVIEAEYRVLPGPENRGVMGASLGGVTSVFFGHYHPDLFGFVGGHSCALWIEEEQIIDEIEADTATDVRYYLDVGTFEGDSIEGTSQRLRDVLLAKGNEVSYLEWHDGHSWGNWRAHIDEILVRFQPGTSHVEE